jgi:two-component system chemotaxis response regulator CheB
MAAIRVLIVDDSAAVRIMLGEILDAEPGIQVVGALASGEEALEWVARTRPDIITLDIEMPGRSGLEVLSELHAAHPQLPVIMFSGVTRHAAETTFEALSRGATDYITKPLLTRSRADALEQIRAQLVPRVRALGGRRLASAGRRGSLRPRRLSIGPPAGKRSRSLRPPDVPPPAIDVVVMASSTGGPNALSVVLRELPVLRVPLLIVQHMPPVFTRLLAERLSAGCQMPVREATNGQTLEAGHVWLAPGDFHMRVEGRRGTTRITLDQTGQEHSCRPAVDVLLRSVASTYGGHVLSVVLTGMGQDGLRGCVQLHAKGAQIIAQDEASSVVWGMPGAIARAGIASAILPLDSIAGEIARRLQQDALPTPPQRIAG